MKDRVLCFRSSSVFERHRFRNTLIVGAMLKNANSTEPVVKLREMLHIFYVLYYGDQRDPVLLISAQHRLARVKLSGILGNILRVRWGRVPEGTVDALLASADVAAIKGRLLNLYNLGDDLFNFCQKSLPWADKAHKKDQIMAKPYPSVCER